MVDCIVCRKPLQDCLRKRNQEYHPECKNELSKDWIFFEEKTVEWRA